jgi:hypothetical protein
MMDKNNRYSLRFEDINPNLSPKFKAYEMSFAGFHSDLADLNLKQFLVPFYAVVEKIKVDDVPKWINGSVTVHAAQ